MKPKLIGSIGYLQPNLLANLEWILLLDDETVKYIEKNNSNCFSIITIFWWSIIFSTVLNLQEK
jgi:hypothetical protein